MPSGRGVKSTVSSEPAVATRQAPWRSESGKAAPPKRRAKRCAAVARIAARDVEVDDGPAQEPVAHGAADDPGLLAGQDLRHALIHREPPAAPDRRPCTIPVAIS